jgi:hypothetical protein
MSGCHPIDGLKDFPRKNCGKDKEDCLCLTVSDVPISTKEDKCKSCLGIGKVRVEPRYSLSGDGLKVEDQRHFGPVEYTCDKCSGKGIIWK